MIFRRKKVCLQSTGSGLCYSRFMGNRLFSLSFSAAIFHSGSSTAVEPSPHSRDFLQLRRYWSKSVSLPVGSWNWRQVNHTYFNVYEYFFLSLFSFRPEVLFCGLDRGRGGSHKWTVILLLLQYSQVSLFFRRWIWHWWTQAVWGKFAANRYYYKLIEVNVPIAGELR